MKRTTLIFFFIIDLTLCGVRKGVSQTASPDGPLSLDEAIHRALTQNPELKSMGKEVEAAYEKIGQARSWEDPQVGVRLYQVPFGKGLSDAADIDYIVAQKIPFPGKKKAQGQIAYHDYLHHDELLTERQRVLLRNLKVSYYELFAIGQLIGTSRHTEALLKNMIGAAQAKVAVNQASTIDSIQGQTELARLLTERETLFERKRILEARLNQIMAQSITQKITLPSHLELPRWNPRLEELLALAQENHPSVKLAEHQIGQKEWSIKAAKREYLPDFNAQVEYVWRPGPADDAWTAELMMNLPLNFRKKRKAVSQAQAELASAQYAHLSAKNDIAYRVREFYAKLRSSERILQINRTSLLPQTRQALEALSNQYTYQTTGANSNFLAWLNAARGLLTAQDQYWKAYQEQSAAIFELEEAIGGTQ